MNKILGIVKNIFEKKFGNLISLTLLNFSIFGFMRYFSGRYINYPFYIKSFKFIMAFFSFIIFFTLIYFLLNLINKRLSDVILKFYTIVSYVLFIVDFLILKEFNLYISTSTIQILSETNKNEATEFLSSYLDLKSLVLVLFLCIIIYLFSKIKIKIYSRKVLYFLLFLMIVQLSLVKENKKILSRTPLGRVYVGVKDVENNKKVYKELAKKINSDVKILANEENIKNIVFVIGESTTRNHMSLYSYNKKTSPNLERIRENGNLFVFDDVISPHGYTMASLQKVLTFYNRESSKEWWQHNNIIDIMKAAGYYTYWFSNQDTNGFAANIGKRANLFLWNNILDDKEFETKIGNFDGEIVEKSKFKIDKDTKNFVCYHLIGTHSEFDKRYPKEFDYFKDEDYDKKLSDKKRKAFKTYDNAIRYNDYVIKKIIDIYKNQDSIIIYISDHAEDLYELGYKGHGEGRLSRYTVEIPMIIYVSNEFKKNHPLILNKIRNSTHRPYVTDDLIHTILDIDGIKTEEFDESRSLINENFNSSRKRILKGKSYDEYYKINQ